MNDLYIFDLEVLCDTLTYKPNVVGIKIFNQLINDLRWTDGSLRKDKPDVIIFSMRSNIDFKKTAYWLEKNTDLFLSDIIKTLEMRPHDCGRPEFKLKKLWYEGLSENDKERLVCVFEAKSDSTVSMWRSLNVPCMQLTSRGA